MRIGKGNGKGSGGMLTGNSILVKNAARKESLKDPNKIFVGNMHWNTTKADLMALGSKFGSVAHVKVVMNHYTKLSKGFGFIRFCDPISATSALSSLPGTELHGRALRCDNVEEKEKPKKKKGKSAQLLAAGSEEPLFDIVGAMEYNDEDITIIS
jgi:RNA recognition motif-containing protein